MALIKTIFSYFQETHKSIFYDKNFGLTFTTSFQPRFDFLPDQNIFFQENLFVIIGYFLI